MTHQTVPTNSLDKVTLQYVWDVDQLIWVRKTDYSIVGGSVYDAGAGKILKSRGFSLETTGIIIPAVAGKVLKIYAVKLLGNSSLNVGFRSGTELELEGLCSLKSAGGYIESVNPPSWLFATLQGQSLELIVIGNGKVSGRVSYWDDDNE